MTKQGPEQIATKPFRLYWLPPRDSNPDMLLQSYRARYQGSPVGSIKLNDLPKNCAHRDVSSYLHILHISKDYVRLMPQICHITRFQG